MIYKLLLLLILIFLSLEIYYHHVFIKKIINDLPESINAPLDNSIVLPKIKNISKIPKKLYRTYYDLNIAKKFQKAHKITKNNNPELEEIIYDDNMIENYIIKNYSSRIYNAYKSINNNYGPAKADFFRYLIIYKEGGIYLDIKSALIKNIEEILTKDKLIISKGRCNNITLNFGIINQYRNSYNWSKFSGVKYHGEFNNWCIISPPGNYVLEMIIKQMVSNIEYGLKRKEKYNNGEYSVLALTGPIMFSRVILKYGNKDNILISENNLEGKVVYSLYDFDHKKIGYKKHYSKLKNKHVLNFIKS